MEATYKSRRRVNVSTSVKGVKTWDATVELIDGTNEEVLAESDALVEKLDKRYPFEVKSEGG